MADEGKRGCPDTEALDRACARLRQAWDALPASEDRRIRMHKEYFCPFDVQFGFRSLREIGVMHGVSRERARQLVAKAHRYPAVQALRPLIQDVLKAIAAAAPMRFDVSAPVLSSGTGITRLAKGFDIPIDLKVDVLRGTQVLRASGDVSPLQAFLKLLSDETQRRCIASVPDALSQAAGEDEALRRRLMRFCRRDIPLYSLAWLSADERHAQIGPSCHKFWRGLERMLLLYGMVSEEDAAAALLHTYRHYVVEDVSAELQEALLEAAAAVPFVARSAGRLVLLPDVPLPYGGKLSHMEGAMGRYIAERGEVTIDELAHRFELKHEIVSVAACYTPLWLPTGRMGRYRALLRDGERSRQQLRGLVQEDAGEDGLGSF